MENIKRYLKEYGLKLNLHNNSLDISDFRERKMNTENEYIIESFEAFIGYIVIEDWKRYFKPKKNITKEAEEEISYIFDKYSLSLSDEFEMCFSGLNFFIIAKEKVRGVDVLIDGWELRRMFMDKEEALSELFARLIQKFDKIINEDIFCKIAKELPDIIMGKKI